MFRIEKDEKNHDDFKVLLFGVMLAILIMIGTPTLMTIWDKFYWNKPFVSATLEIIENDAGSIYILYDTDAVEEVDGEWIASILGENDEQINTRRGEGSYNTKIDNPRPWTWFAFFDNDKGLSSPQIPNVPFKVCVRYIVSTRDSGVVNESPDYCSEIYEPRS